VQIPDGTIHRTLSAASDHLTQFSNNGWEFWRIDSPSDQRTIGEVRSNYLGSQGPQPHDDPMSDDAGHRGN
jgi:hypothetical protein